MMELRLTRGENQTEVPLRLPTSPAEVGEAYAWLDNISRYAGETRIVGVRCPIPNLGQYIRSANLDHGDDLQKLNALAERIGGMEKKEQVIFSGALDAESINSLDDVLRIALSLESYAFIPNASSDTELGRYVAVAGQIHDDPRFPEAAWPYLDFAKIGAEYYADHGGAYTAEGYVFRKQSAEPERKETEIFRLHLAHGENESFLSLPASDVELDAVRRKLGIEEFAGANIKAIDFSIPYMEGTIPVDCISVESANELALEVEEMRQTDGELLKYLSVLSVEQPDDFPAALRLALDLDDYERITEGTYEYGQSVLRRIGADDEIISTIDGYMDFEKFGEDAMVEDGVRQTEFGMIRRCSTPFPEETQTMKLGGM